jgi:hypothetical protein
LSFIKLTEEQIDSIDRVAAAIAKILWTLY